MAEVYTAQSIEDAAYTLVRAIAGPGIRRDVARAAAKAVVKATGYAFIDIVLTRSEFPGMSKTRRLECQRIAARFAKLLQNEDASRLCPAPAEP